MHWHRLHVVGRCRFKGKDCKKIPCSTVRKAICASDGKPYHNECAMRRHACMQKEAKIAVRKGDNCLKYDSLSLGLIVLMSRWICELLIAAIL